MEFKKERNIIFAYDMAGTKLGGWNISTGEFIGKSGKVVKGTPTCFTYNNLNRFHVNILAGAICLYRETWQNIGYGYTTERANRLEQMISVGIYPYRYTDLDSTVTLSKDLVEWIKAECRGQYIAERVNAHLAIIQFSKQIPDMPDWVQCVLPDLINEGIPSSFFVPAIKRAINEHWEYIATPYYNRSSFFRGILLDYYNMSMQMWGKVNVEPNMLTGICKIRKLYKEYADAHYDDMLRTNNDKPWLYFENELLTAKPLLTRKDFHDEGEAQHNCVERMYMEQVKDGRTHIVRIRYKSDPNHAYITCEVNNRGQIVQYLTFGNHYVTDRGGLMFRDLYQTHILSHMK